VKEKYGYINSSNPVKNTRNDMKEIGRREKVKVRETFHGIKV
jgi:hypothetical protein